MVGAGVTLFEYSPNEVKMAVTGWGGADKLQVQQMVQVLLGLPELPHPPDAADAAALALCHLAMAPMRHSSEHRIVIPTMIMRTLLMTVRTVVIISSCTVPTSERIRARRPTLPPDFRTASC